MDASQWKLILRYELGGWELGHDKTVKVKNGFPSLKKMNRLLAHHEPGFRHVPRYCFFWGGVYYWHMFTQNTWEHNSASTTNYPKAPSDSVVFTQKDLSKCKAENKAIHTSKPPKKLTWKLKICHWKRRCLFTKKTNHVSFILSFHDIFLGEPRGVPKKSLPATRLQATESQTEHCWERPPRRCEISGPWWLANFSLRELRDNVPPGPHVFFWKKWSSLHFYHLQCTRSRVIPGTPNNGTPLW